MERFAARKTIVQRLEDFGFLEKIEPNTHMVPHGDRSDVVIEPYLTDQWYVDAKTLAQPAIAAVRTGATDVRAEELGKDLFRVDGEHPALVHLAPAVVGPSDPGVVRSGRQGVRRRDRGRGGRQRARLLRRAGSHHGRAGPRAWRSIRRKREGFITRDEDVLDTWFSSALWPFSTLGWPQTRPRCERYYPTNVLVTGFDIIFFWVARMMMMGLHFKKDVPFPTVYIHALVRDEKGAKMSKSKGNVIDPLNLIDQYGADALRFTLAAMAAQGRDIQLATQRVEGYRNFATKLWNACRFAEMNECVLPAGFDPTKAKEVLNRWIAHETVKATREVTEAIEAYRFNDAAGAAYRFVWNVYCDWYLELAKPFMMGEDGPAKTETRAMVAWARDEILKLLHPFMPFITEELLGRRRRRATACWRWRRGRARRAASTREQEALIIATAVERSDRRADPDAAIPNRSPISRMTPPKPRSAGSSIW